MNHNKFYITAYDVCKFCCLEHLNEFNICMKMVFEIGLTAINTNKLNIKTS